MDYYITIHLVSRSIIYVLGAIFLFIFISGDRQYKVHSFILLSYFILSIFIPELNKSALTYGRDWIDQCFISLQIAGATSLALLIFLPLDKLNKYHWIILILTVVTHSMVTSYLEVRDRDHWVVIYGMYFYDYYDELIILTYLAMIGVSYNGLNTAYNNSLGAVQRFIYGPDVYYDRFSRALLEKEKAKKR